MANYEVTVVSLNDVDCSVSKEEEETGPRQKITTALCDSSLLVRRVLRPLVYCLKIFGLYFGPYCPLDKTNGIGHRIGLIYSICVLLLLIFNVIRHIFAFIYSKDLSVYVHLENLVWFFKCTVQAAYCLLICRISAKGVPSKIQQLLAEYDETLNWFSVQNLPAKKRFLRRSNIIFGLFLTVISTNIIFSGVIFFGPFEDLNLHAAPYLHPFSDNTATRILCWIILIYNSVAWVFPVILYCILCDSLSLIFSHFYLSIQKLDEKLVIKRHVREIRHYYIHITELCGKTDELLGVFAICVYFLDMILSCFNLYHLIKIANDIPERLLTGFWAMVTIGNLIIMSLSASHLADKVRKKCMKCSV